MTGSLQTVQLAGETWGLADPLETQNGSDVRVPAGPALYLWLRRETPGPFSAATQDVLFVGKSKNLRRRLRQLTSGVARADVALQAVFDFQIAPRLDGERLKQVVVDRRALPLAQMWIRDHVMFAWLSWSDERSRTSDEILCVDGIRGAVSMRDAERMLVSELRPLLAVQEVWAQHGTTEHQDHDLTLPLIPVRLPDGPWLY